MDSTDAPRGRWLLLPLLALPVIAWTTTLPGCADPCLDDGLGQKFCPPTDTQAGTGSETAAGDGDGDSNSNSNSNTGDGDGDLEAGETDGCPLLDVILVPQTPTLILVVDQSISMDQAFGNGTRWTVLTSALIDPNTGIVPLFASEMRLGLTLYSWDSMGVDQCPTLTQVAPALDNADPITTTLNMSAPLGETPTGESLDIIWPQLDAFPEPGRKFIVLATDGEPDTCAVPNPQMGQPESLAAVTAAYGAGIETFIISVGDEVSTGHLQDMANAGQGVQPGDPDAPYYLALDPAMLQDAFQNILAGVRSCQLDLDTALTPEDAATCTVEVNGADVPMDDPNGWQQNTPTEIELLGTACDALQMGASSVQMTCACGVGGLP